MVRNPEKSVPPKRRKYTAADMAKAVRLVMVDKYDVRRAALQAEVPRSTLQDHLNKLRKEGTSMDVSFSKLGRKTALTEVEEKVLADLLEVCAGWGFSFTMVDVCNLVKEYLDSIPRKVEQFRDNRPGRDWASAFLKVRHPWLCSRFALNSKCRPDIGPELITSCISELVKTVNGCDPANAVSYVETCFADETDKVKATFPRISLAKVTASNKATKKERGKPRCRSKINIPAKVLKKSESKVPAKTSRTTGSIRARAKSKSAVPAMLEG